jgi:hypothetical protein
MYPYLSDVSVNGITYPFLANDLSARMSNFILDILNFKACPYLSKPGKTYSTYPFLSLLIHTEWGKLSL